MKKLVPAPTFTLVFLCGLALPFLLWVVGSSLQEPRASFPRKTYSSFEGVEWGTPPSEVLDRVNRSGTVSIQREPVFPNETPSGTKLTIKNRRRNGDTVDVGYVFHPDRGLVKGFYFARFDRGDDCRTVFNRYYTSINQKIGEHNLREGENNQLDVPFCYAVLVGKAEKYAQWKTPEGLTVTMIVGGERSKRRVRVFFETSAFYEWKRALDGDDWISRITDWLSR